MSDYLKYWRVIRYWVKAKYNIGTPELEIMSWDTKRFNNLLRDGWLQVFRRRSGKNATLYELSYKGKSLVRTVYRKLNGEEVGESPNINPLFRLDASYMDKMQRKMIKEMNEFIKQQRHLSPE